MENQPLLLSLQQAAAKLSLSIWTLRGWIKNGKLPCVRMGSRVLVEPGELEKLIAAGRKPAEENRNG